MLADHHADIADADKADGLHEILRWKSLIVFLVIMGTKAWCVTSQTAVFRKIERNHQGAFHEDSFVDFEAAQSLLVKRVAFRKAPCLARYAVLKRGHATAVCFVSRTYPRLTLATGVPNAPGLVSAPDTR
jgi:hypothetical protein